MAGVEVIVDPHLRPADEAYLFAAPRPLSVFDLYFAVRCALHDRGVGDDVIVRTEEDEWAPVVRVVVYCERTARFLTVEFTKERLHAGDVYAMFVYACQVATYATQLVAGPARLGSILNTGSVR